MSHMLINELNAVDAGKQAVKLLFLVYYIKHRSVVQSDDLTQCSACKEPLTDHTVVEKFLRLISEIGHLLGFFLGYSLSLFFSPKCNSFSILFEFE